MFVKLAGKAGEDAPVLQINHRPLQAIRSVDGVLAVDFHTLCEEARSQLDYIALSRLYHSVILYNVQVMGPLKENTARRFLGVGGRILRAAHQAGDRRRSVDVRDLSGVQLKFEFQRCLSRLQEMQSEEYLKLPHLP